MKFRHLLPLLLSIAMLTVAAAATNPLDSSVSPDGKLNLNEAQKRRLVLYAPHPTYPYEARRLHAIGS